MDELQAINAFAALAQDTRLRMLKYLVRCGPTGANAGAIAKAADASASRSSFHLSALAQAGLIQAQRQSRQIIYRADYAHMGELVRFLLQDCCGEHPEIMKCCAPDLTRTEPDA